MYSVHAYGKMLKDTIRMAAYQQALQRAVKPGMIVLDIGTGTGIHALMAAKLGARHVYAVEPADSITLAPTIAKQNDCADAITFIQNFSTRIDLPERADLVVSDLHGTLPWYQQHIPTIVDARSRLLKEGGLLIPQRDKVYVVPVEAPSLYAKYTEPWLDSPYGFDFSHVTEKITNNYIRGRVGRDAFLSEPALAAEVDYRHVSDPNVRVALDFETTRSGTLHGFMIWFDTVVHEDITLTSAPYEPEISYGSSFFPLSGPVSMSPGERIHFTWQGALQDDYIWMWRCDVRGNDGAVRAAFRQNTMQGAFMSMDSLKKRAPSYRPRLSDDGEIDRTILNLMSEGGTVEEIARELVARMDGRLATEAEAQDRVRAMSERYG